MRKRSQVTQDLQPCQVPGPDTREEPTFCGARAVLRTPRGRGRISGSTSPGLPASVSPAVKRGWGGAGKAPASASHGALGLAAPLPTWPWLAPAPRPPPPSPAQPGAGPGRHPKLVKNPAVSESSSFPTSERQTSPLLLYYNVQPDGLLGVAPPRPPPEAALIHSEATPGTNAAGLRHTSTAAAQPGNRGRAPTARAGRAGPAGQD